MPQLPIESIIIRAIDQGLDVLGESPKKALLYHLENGLGVSGHNAFSDIERFEKALRLFFGPGYTYLDSVFRQNLQNFSGENLENYKSFSECVGYLSSKCFDGVLK